MVVLTEYGFCGFCTPTPTPIFLSIFIRTSVYQNEASLIFEVHRRLIPNEYRNYHIHRFSSFDLDP
jgi:hypothetical protein